MKAEKPDQNAIQAKQKELNALGDQMQEKMTAFQLEAKKIAPDFDMGMGMGWVPDPGRAWASAQVLDRRLRLLLLAANDPGTAQELLNKTENGGKALPLWDGDWPRRFFYTGRDLDFQKVQRTLARQDMISISSQGRCGEDDFRYRREKEALTSGWKKGIFQPKN